jgi:transcriptional regulator with XRE-family HTH domain
MTTATDLPLHTAAGIRELRGRLAMTQERFAETLGVSVRTVRGWEQGQLPPGADRIARMRYLASDRTTRAVGLVATLRETATYFALDGSEGIARELRRIADNHEAQITER